MKIYELSTEDMTTLGCMGTEPTTISRVLYTTVAKAKAAAEADWEGDKFKWKKVGHGYTSPDLGQVMYEIREVRVL